LQREKVPMLKALILRQQKMAPMQKDISVRLLAYTAMLRARRVKLRRITHT
jgi:hypothetical protein